MKTRSDEKLRAWWSHKQALDGRLAGAAAADVLAETGWARSVGGVGPYLTLHARAGTPRQVADADVAALRLHELPAARGCTYVVPAVDFALALKAGVGFDTDMKTALKLGVTEKEVDRLCEAVMQALGNSAVSPDELRDAVGPAARNLGEEGKKKGVTTTLPLALGKLQTAGEIRRVPMNGRLDQQRYKYAAWRPNPLANFHMSAEEVAVELARRYFRWIGPATLSEFQWFSALGVKAAKSAVEGLKLMSFDGDRMITAEDRERFERFTVPREPDYRLVSSLDALSLLRRDLKSIVDPPDLERMAEGERSGGALMDLPSHAIIDRGRVVGLWEYDQTTQSITWLPFVTRSAALKKAVLETENYIRDQVGDARSFSLDSPKSRIPRIEALRQAAGK